MATLPAVSSIPGLGGPIPGLPSLPNLSTTTASASNPVVVFGSLVTGDSNGLSEQLPSVSPSLIGSHPSSLLGVPVNYVILAAAIGLGFFLKHKGL